MPELVKKITEKTLVPISLVIALMGGGSWMTSINSKADANALTLNRTVDTQKELLMYVIEIKQDLAEIKGQLKRMNRN